MNKLCDEAYEKAVNVLHECIDRSGIKASAKKDGYPQIWARDSMITLLGASLSGDEKIIKSLKASINTLRNNQTKLGLIPNNVSIKNQKANFQAYADGGLWFIIGNAFLYKQINDLVFLKKNYKAIKKIITWYEYQDVDQSGLVNMAEGSDWEDLFAVRGKGLYVNALHCMAIDQAVFIAKKLNKNNDVKLFSNINKKLKPLINKHFWYNGDGNVINNIKLSLGTEFFNKNETDSLDRKMIFPKKTILKNSNYYLPYFTFRNFGEWFDSLGNILTILSGVANKKQAHYIFEFIKKNKLIKPYPIKAIFPPIFPKGKDWRYYYNFGGLNLPNQYHNGGIWPFLGGFYITALVKAKKFKEAEKELLQLALLNQKGKNQWEFNEWFHGKTGEPKGMVNQAWSAGMYIYAYKSVESKKSFL